jgi:hypothetical protein
MPPARTVVATTVNVVERSQHQLGKGRGISVATRACGVAVD